MAAGRGKKVSDAYIELRAEDSKLGADVKVKATKAAREFGGALNRRLATLDLGPVDVKANPAQALAAIEATRERLLAMSRDAETVEIRVRAERALAQLDRFRKQLGSVGDEEVTIQADPSPAQQEVDKLQRRLAALGVDPPVQIDADPKQALAAVALIDRQLKGLSENASSVQLRMDAESARGDLAKLRQRIESVGGDSATGLVANLGGRMGPLMARLPLSPHLAAALGIAVAAAAPTLGAALAAGVIGGAGAGGIVGGLIAAKDHPAVAAAATGLGDRATRMLRSSFLDFVPVTVDALGIVDRRLADMEPQFDRLSRASARFVAPLTEAAATGVEDVFGEVVDLAEQAGPVVDELADSFVSFGDAVADGLDLLEDNSHESARALAILLGVFEGVVRGGFYLINTLAETFSWMEKIGGAIRGDVGPLLRGFSEDEEEAADKTGGLSEEVRKLYENFGSADDATAQLQLRMKNLQSDLNITGAQFAAMGDIGRQNMQSLLLSTGLVTGAMVAQRGKAELLRSATDAMYGSVIKQIEANESYEASWDALSESVEKNGGSLKRTTEAGRANRDALQDLLQATNEQYFADIEAGVAIKDAEKKHRDRTAAIREESRRLGLNKTETQNLIAVYGKIPPKKTTQLLLEGFDRIVRALEDLYLFQRGLARGITLDQARKELHGFNFKGHFEGGEITGQGLKGVDSQPILAAPGEFMQPVPAVDYYGVAAMQAIRHRQIPREALRPYATGGLIDRLRDRDWGSRMRYDVDVTKTRIPSREEVANKVIPEFGAWPSSPSAQRGDSGVWKRIMMLVRNSGIPYSFGNAYRPGDPKWHGSGRAVDFMGYNQDRLAQFFMGMQPRILELIHRTNRGDYAVTRGRRTSMPTQLPLHRNHLHVAMDNGGELMPGWNPPIYNGTGRPEPVTPAPVMDDVIELLGDLIEAVKGDGARVAGALRGPGPTLRTRARAL
jgi:hypothetical protein